MEPGRFDDVEFQFLERPEPSPRGPRRKRFAAALVAAALLAGGITAGASALSDSGARPAAPAKAKPKVFYNADGVPTVRDGHGCRAGEGGKRHRRDRDSSSSAGSVRY
jgi:hypothetical protein